MSAVNTIPIPGCSAAAMRTSRGSESGFIAGPENRLVGAIADRLVHSQNDSFGFRTIALIGPSGSGKTHLARGIADLWSQRSEKSNAIYVTALDFRRRLDHAIASHTTSGFRHEFRSANLLVLDDLHRLPAAPYVQEELLGLLDAMPENGLFLATSSQLPVSIPGLLPAITNRLAAGLLLELAPLGHHARGELLAQCLAAQDRQIDPAAVEMFAARLDGEAPQVLRAVAELCAAIPRHACIDEPQMKRFLDLRTNNGSASVHDIVKLVARYHKISPKMLTSSTRRRALVEARGVVIYLARHLLGTSFEQLGQALGGRDHSTIMHSFRQIEKSLANDLQLRSCIDDLKRLLRAA